MRANLVKEISPAKVGRIDRSASRRSASRKSNLQFRYNFCPRAAEHSVHLKSIRPRHCVLASHDDRRILRRLQGVNQRAVVAVSVSIASTNGFSLLNRDSPDESQTGVNVRVFPALLQDSREVLTATSTSGNPSVWWRV